MLIRQDRAVPSLKTTYVEVGKIFIKMLGHLKFSGKSNLSTRPRNLQCYTAENRSAGTMICQLVLLPHRFWVWSYMQQKSTYKMPLHIDKMLTPTFSVACPCFLCIRVAF